MSPITLCWVPTCDFCGDGLSDGEDLHYDTEDEAVAFLKALEWRLLDDGRWECFDCRDCAKSAAGAT